MKIIFKNLIQYKLIILTINELPKFCLNFEAYKLLSSYLQLQTFMVSMKQLLSDYSVPSINSLPYLHFRDPKKHQFHQIYKFYDVDYLLYIIKIL